MDQGIFNPKGQTIFWRGFSGMRSGEAGKKTGMASLNKVLKTTLAGAPLVQNLKNDKYMENILNGCSGLAERFSQIDAYEVQQEMSNATKSNDKILPSVKKLIRDAELTMKISALFCPSTAK
jgi:hypothetical protein